jgi:hypothetical protein
LRWSVQDFEDKQGFLLRKIQLQVEVVQMIRQRQYLEQQDTFELMMMHQDNELKTTGGLTYNNSIQSVHRHDSVPYHNRQILWSFPIACIPLFKSRDLGVLPIDAEEMPGEEAWTIGYQHIAELVRAGGVFDQFKERLQDHPKQVHDQTAWATQEEEALEHDRWGIFPQQTRNHRGKPSVVEVSNAKMLLCGDLADGKHLTMQPALLQQLHREYHPFKPRKVKEQIYQEVCRVKFLNYLEQKRADKEGLKLVL